MNLVFQKATNGLYSERDSITSEDITMESMLKQEIVSKLFTLVILLIIASVMIIGRISHSSTPETYVKETKITQTITFESSSDGSIMKCTTGKFSRTCQSINEHI